MALEKERILRLAALIETQPLVSSRTIRKINGFSMAVYVHDCGTPSCIAGFAAADSISQGPEDVFADAFDSDIAEMAKVWLGLTDEQAVALFIPAIPVDRSLWQITPAEAAKTLRILAETGKIDWSHLSEGN